MDDLKHRFEALREADARSAPPFGAMLDRARVAASAHPVAPEAPVRTTTRRMWLLAVGAPLAVAAGLGFLWLRPARADLEFEQTVQEWTRTTGSAFASPTDGLLQVPGSEYLRGTPRVGGIASDRSPT